MMNPEIYPQFLGEAGTYQTIQMMKGLVNSSFLHPYIRERAAQIAKSCERNQDCEDMALMAFVRSAIQYLRDPAGTEALHNPITFIEEKLRKGERPFGDCDDMSIYLGSLLKSIGHRPYFLVLSRDGRNLHHVLIYCHNKMLDPTMEIGRLPEDAKRKVLIGI